jgi:putative salt-induced outer membrane protein YdiY
MVWLFVLVLLLIPGRTAWAQPADEISQDILARERRLGQALQANDRPTMEALLAPEYVLRGFPDVPRDRWIANAIDLCWGKTFELTDFDTRRDGDTIIASFIFTFDQDPVTCKPAVLRSLITDVWARAGGEWRLLLRHTSAATRPDSPDSLGQQFAAVPEPPPVWQLDSELSFVATGGNTDTQTLGTAGDLRHRQGRWNSTARGSFVRSTAGGIESARALLLEVRPGRELTPRLTLFGRTGFRRDLFAGIESRLAYGAGLAYRVIDNRRQELQVEGGGGYDRERRLGAAELRFGTVQGRLNYRWRVSPSLTVDNAAAVAADPQDAGNWRGSNKASATVSVSRMLSLKLSHALEYLNEPVPGFRQIDTITSVGLVVTLRR